MICNQASANGSYVYEFKLFVSVQIWNMQRIHDLWRLKGWLGTRGSGIMELHELTALLNLYFIATVCIVVCHFVL